MEVFVAVADFCLKRGAKVKEKSSRFCARKLTAFELKATLVSQTKSSESALKS